MRGAPLTVLALVIAMLVIGWLSAYQVWLPLHTNCTNTTVPNQHRVQRQLHVKLHLVDCDAAFPRPRFLGIF